MDEKDPLLFDKLCEEIPIDALRGLNPMRLIQAETFSLMTCFAILLGIYGSPLEGNDDDDCRSCAIRFDF